MEKILVTVDNFWQVSTQKFYIKCYNLSRGDDSMDIKEAYEKSLRMIKKITLLI